MQETPGCCVCTDLCGYDRDPGLCLVSTFSPFILLSQLVERLQKGTCLGTFVGIVSLEVLAAVFFYEVEEAQVEAWARVFNMITCASPTWSSVAGIKGGLPQWMTNSGNNDVKDGTVFPCVFPNNEPKNYFDYVSTYSLIMFILAAICQLAAIVVFVYKVVQVRAALREREVARGNCCTDVILSIFCWPCFLSQTARTAGVVGKTYSFTAVDAEIGIAHPTEAVKLVPK